MEFDNSIPIYQQIVVLIKNRIISGELASGDKIKSVRDLARELGVNPNTVQKALGVLEQEKLLTTERTSGKYVAAGAEEITRMRAEKIREMVNEFLTEMDKLGVNRAEILEIIGKAEGGEGQ